MALIGQPPQTDVDSKLGQGWMQWFSDAYTILNAVTLSGTTAQRPTKLLWAGRPYFDKSLGANGRPIWVNKLGTGWVFADGTAA